MAVQDIFVRFRSNAREFAKELLQPQKSIYKIKKQIWRIEIKDLAKLENQVQSLEGN